MRPIRATIEVQGLRLRTYIGFNPEEQEKLQDVVIHLEIGHRIGSGVFADNVDHALNYRTITKAVIEHVEGGRFLLLEKLAGDILEICTRHESVLDAKVSVHKPHALRFADSVSITLEHEPARHASLQENAA